MTTTYLRIDHLRCRSLPPVLFDPLPHEAHHLLRVVSANHLHLRLSVLVEHLVQLRRNDARPACIVEDDEWGLVRSLRQSGLSEQRSCEMARGPLNAFVALADLGVVEYCVCRLR